MSYSLPFNNGVLFAADVQKNPIHDSDNSSNNSRNNSTVATKNNTINNGYNSKIDNNNSMSPDTTGTATMIVMISNGITTLHAC